MRKVYGVVLAAITAIAVAVALVGVLGDYGSKARAAGTALELRGTEGVTHLPKPATRVIALDFNFVEDLVALGVPPVGVAYTEGYRKLVSGGPRLPDGIVDVGARNEPDLDKVFALKPDLIVVNASKTPTNMWSIKGIAPIVMLNPAAKPALQSMRYIVSELGRAVGRTEKARELIEAFDTKLAATRTRLARAGKASAWVGLATGATINGTPTLRVYGDASLPGQVLSSVGLLNAWTGTVEETSFTTGTASIGPENLVRFPSDTTFFTLAQPYDDVFATRYSHDPAWRSLPMVKQQRVRALNAGTWLNGGPLSCAYLLDEVVRALGA